MPQAQAKLRMLQGGMAGARPSGMAQVGTTEHTLVLLVIAELALLFLARRYFAAAHGG